MSYHIAKNGAPAICTAQPGKCPLGNQDKHFDTVEEAQVYADQLNQKDRAAKLRSNELQQAIKDRKQKQNRLFKNPFKN